jgi:hypothetical protein
MIKESDVKIVEDVDINTGTARIRITHTPSGKYIDSEYIRAGNNRLNTISSMWAKLDALVNPPVAQSTLLQYFNYEHLPEHLKFVSAPICELAKLLDEELQDSPEKSAGMRKLLEAKDCFVRARL